ncbi:MAG: cupredoxin domain-containing protein [Thermomicrobiales bacterium]
MGAVQRLATVVVIGLVALSTVLVLYLADEGNRVDAQKQNQKEAAIERGIDTYLTFCLACHGPAGEGSQGPDGRGTGRIGLPLGGDTYATRLNQEGINSEGTPVPLDVRAEQIEEVIYDGRGAMPAWGDELNDEQIDELVIMIQNVDWNRVYNEAIASAGGYPTPPPAAQTDDAGAAATDPETEPAEAEDPAESDDAAEGVGDEAAGAEQAQEQATAIQIDMVDFAFEPPTLEVAADTEVTVQLTNSGALIHDFSIEALDINEVLDPGGSAEFTFTAPAGEYEIICTQPGHLEAGMVGTLTAR